VYEPVYRAGRRLSTLPGFCSILVLATGWLVLLATRTVCGQPSFTLSVSDSPDPITANQSLTYVINVTNTTGLFLSDVFVTNRFSGPVQILGTTNSRPATVFLTTNAVTFLIESFPGAGEFTTLSIGIRPTTFGALTNAITVATFNLNVTNAATNVVTQVIAGQPDLAIAIGGPAQPVLVNDWMTYTLTARNVGGDAAPNVVVSNALPADVKIIGIVPSNEVFTVTSNILNWTVGRLGIDEFAGLTVTVQPTNAGIATLFAAVSAANVLDTNNVNNTTSTNIAVDPLLAGSLMASNVSAMTFNRQTGLMEQTVRLVNAGTNAAASARIIVSGLTNRLFNAVGTNDGNPFVVHGATLETNQSVDLLFEYFVPTRLPVLVNDSQLHPFAMPAFNLAPPGGEPLVITLVTNLAKGDILIEFASVPGQRYTVLYSADPSFTNGLAAQPPIVAPADRVQWIDDGPPKTVSRPASVGSRFYRVIQNP
jgi:uncharacterized repeat protein (TIGR01451 family)